MAFSIRLLPHRRRPDADKWENYTHWLRETRDHLEYATSRCGEAPQTEVTIYLGPSIRVLPEQRAWALRAVQEEHLEWAFGHAWGKLPPKPERSQSE